jgi:hypothetical protein
MRLLRDLKTGERVRIFHMLRGTTGSWAIMNSTRALSARAGGVTPPAQKTGISPA